MEQSPSWEAYSFLWSANVHNHVHNSQPVVSILSQMISIHNFPPYFSKKSPNATH